MRPVVAVAFGFAWLGATALSAQEAANPSAGAAGPGSPPAPVVVEFVPAAAPSPHCPVETTPAAVPWQTVWGVAGLRAIPAGPKTAPNGLEYHPNFSMDLDLNGWLWRSQGLYLFGDARFWGQKSEDGVTNSRDGVLGTSKREFDLSGGAAWNYWGAWEARAWGYSFSNLNRGNSPVTPSGFNDGSCLENRYYLSPEYANLGKTGFDVTRASFVSAGYYPSKEMVGNDGQLFKPGAFVRAYLTWDLWELPCYAFGDATLLCEQSFRAKLFLFDLGLAARPFHRCEQCEFRLGVENTGDFDTHGVQNLWYISVRYVF
jgi:hypothetical protein